MATPGAGEGIVDVVIAAWNRADTIERAVLSALAEAEVRTVFVVDDGSTDDTVARAERIGLQDKRVVVSGLPTNCGPSAARNRALALSSAPWIAILDGDDFFLPGRIAKLLAAADAFDFVGDDILQIEEARIGRANPQPVFAKRSGPWRLDFETFVTGNVSRSGASRRELGFLKPLVRRSFLNRHGLGYEEDMRLGEDYALYAHSLAVGGRFVVLPPCGYVSVVRANSLSGAHTSQDLERLRDFDLKLGAIGGLSDADRRALAAHYQSVDARVRWLAVIDGFRSRSPSRFLSPFACTPAVSGFLLRQLVAEGVRRLPTIGLSR
jgi:succinoglycan biosynthesis protein ExoU